jgi:hypothetical protein
MHRHIKSEAVEAFLRSHTCMYVSFGLPIGQTFKSCFEKNNFCPPFLPANLQKAKCSGKCKEMHKNKYLLLQLKMTQVLRSVFSIGVHKFAPVCVHPLRLPRGKQHYRYKNNRGTNAPRRLTFYPGVKFYP